MMTDPVGGEMASQVVERLAEQTESVDEVESTDSDTGFSEAIREQQPGVDVEQSTRIEETSSVERAEAVEPVERDMEIATDDFVQQLLREESNIQEMMERCLNGGGLEQQEMLQMQALVYSYSQRVELTTKVVEKATGGIEQVLNTQV